MTASPLWRTSTTHGLGSQVRAHNERRFSVPWTPPGAAFATVASGSTRLQACGRDQLPAAQIFSQCLAQYAVPALHRVQLLRFCSQPGKEAGDAQIGPPVCRSPCMLLTDSVVRPACWVFRAIACSSNGRLVMTIYGALHGGEHPFAAETRALLKALPRSHSHIRYSAPRPGDRLAVDFDAPGRLDMHAIEELGVLRDGDFYLCGPSAFMSDLVVELGNCGVAASRIHTEIFRLKSPRTPGIAAAPRRPPHQPAGSAGVGPWCPLHAAA